MATHHPGGGLIEIVTDQQLFEENRPLYSGDGLIKTPPKHQTSERSRSL